MFDVWYLPLSNPHVRTDGTPRCHSLLNDRKKSCSISVRNLNQEALLSVGFISTKDPLFSHYPSNVVLFRGEQRLINLYDDARTSDLLRVIGEVRHTYVTQKLFPIHDGVPVVATSLAIVAWDIPLASG